MHNWFWFCAGQKFNLALPFASFQIGFNIDTEAWRKEHWVNPCGPGLSPSYLCWGVKNWFGIFVAVSTLVFLHKVPVLTFSCFHSCFLDGYESIPINTIFRGMNIHFNPAIFMFTRGTTWVLTHGPKYQPPSSTPKKNWDLFSGTPHPESCASSDGSFWEWNRSCFWVKRIFNPLKAPWVFWDIKQLIKAILKPH